MGVVMTADAVGLRSMGTGMDSSTAALTAEEYALFEQIGRPRLVAAGETLFRRGDLGTTMSVVVQGEIDLDSSEEHTTELQSLRRITYAVCCLKQKTNKKQTTPNK